MEQWFSHEISMNKRNQIKCKIFLKKDTILISHFNGHQLSLIRKLYLNLKEKIVWDLVFAPNLVSSFW